jgi:hypothetical protein
VNHVPIRIAFALEKIAKTNPVRIKNCTVSPGDLIKPSNFCLHALFNLFFHFLFQNSKNVAMSSMPVEVGTQTIEAVESTVAPETDALNKHVRASFLDPAFADVELVVGEETFPAHRMVLAAASPVFK